MAKKIKNVDKKYVKKSYKTIIKSWDELENFQKSVDIQLMEDYGIDMYLGSLKKPSEAVQILLDNNEISTDELPAIRDEIEEALNSGQISPGNVMTRLYYMVDYKDELDKKDHIKPGHCPYCNQTSFEEGVCTMCGYNIFDKRLEAIENELNDKIDSDTGAYKSLLNTIDEKSLDKDKVISYQTEIAAYELLNFINQLPDYPSLPDIDDDHEISEALYINYLKDNNLIELIDNTDKNDEKEFLNMLKENNHMPSTRAYKAHMHRDHIYRITKKGRKYLNQNKIADIYTDKSNNLPYYEFKEFYLENKDSLSMDELLNKYVDKIEEEIIKEDDALKYNDICITKVNQTDNEDKKELITSIIKSLICRLNYHIQSLNSDQNYLQTPIDSYNEVFVMEYGNLIDDYDYNELFDRAFESIKIDTLKTNKKLLHDDIEMILNTDDISKVNMELSVKYNDIL